MIMHMLITASNLSVHRNFASRTADLARILTFSRADKCRQISRRAIIFPLDPKPALIQKIFVSFMPSLLLKLRSVERHILGNLIILVLSTIKIVIAWHYIPAVQEEKLFQHTIFFLFFMTLVPK